MVKTWWLFHELGSLTEYTASLRSKQKLRRRNLKSCPRRFRSIGTSRNSSWGDRGIGWGFHEDGISKENKTFSRCGRSSYGTLIMLSTIRTSDHIDKSLHFQPERRSLRSAVAKPPSRTTSKSQPRIVNQLRSVRRLATPANNVDKSKRNTGDARRITRARTASRMA